MSKFLRLRTEDFDDEDDDDRNNKYKKENTTHSKNDKGLGEEVGEDEEFELMSINDEGAVNVSTQHGGRGQRREEGGREHVKVDLNQRQTSNNFNYSGGKRPPWKLVVAFLATLMLGILIGYIVARLCLPVTSVGDDDKASDSKNLAELEGYTVESLQKIELANQAILNTISPSNIKENLKFYTGQPHIAGSIESYQDALWTQNQLQSFGFKDVRLFKYTVLVSYPCSDKASTIRVLNTTGISGIETLLDIPITERIYTSAEDDARAKPAFLGYSPSGSVNGPLLYVNYGREEDFVRLNSLGLSCQGAIGIARYGKIFRGDKVKFAAKAGCLALLIFSDPNDYSRDESKTYPNGWWLPSDGLQRGSILMEEGDPLTPEMPAVDAAYRYAMNDSVNVGLPSIPAHPISSESAEKLMKAMAGPPAPNDWKGGLKIPAYRLGPGFANGYWWQPQQPLSTTTAQRNDDTRRDMPHDGSVTLHLDICSNFTMVPIYNVVAMIRGSEEPDRIVVAGNHRDAWVFGAVDPSSGSATMLELARTISVAMNQTGWRPRRSLWLASWDAEEYGLIGSTEWADQFKSTLQQRVVAYVNVDIAVEGTDLINVAATPNLNQMAFRAARKVPHPNSNGAKSLFDVWLDKNPSKSDVSKPFVEYLGSGSDYTAFLAHHGVPSIDLRFTYSSDLSSYPVYHSLHDNFDWVARFLDPTFEYHAAVGKFWGLILVDLSSAPILPFDYRDYALAIAQSLIDPQSPSAGTSPGALAAGVNFQKLNNAGFRFQYVMDHFYNETWTKYGGVAEMDLKLRNTTQVSALKLRDLNDRLMQIERHFLIETGLPGRVWYRHMVFAPSVHNYYAGSIIPGVVDAIFEKDWEEAKKQIAILTIALNEVSDFLNDSL